MSDTYTEIYYHLVWTTKNREAMVVPEIEETLYVSIKAICRDLKVTIYALNSMPDHVHLACSLPTTVAVAPLMNKVKGTSAHLINHLPESRHPLAWQPGYGALTFAGRDLKTIVAYIQNQQRHHQDGKLSEKMERTATQWAGAAVGRLRTNRPAQTNPAINGRAKWTQKPSGFEED